MSALRDLPARPSLDSLRKQAKKLARDAAVGNSEALGRVHARLPRPRLPLSNRDAQLVIAREYGFAGWKELLAEVEQRLGRGPEWAFAQAKVAIHDKDDDRLRALLAEFPALLTWRDGGGRNLFAATEPYALDCSDPERERLFTRPAAAEILIDAGATIDRPTWECFIWTGSSGMLHLLARKNVLPRTLPVLAALGEKSGLGALLDESPDQGDIARALVNACRFKHAGLAMKILERSVALDPDLGRRIDRWQGRQAFVEFLVQHHASMGSDGPTEGPETTPWQAFVIRQLTSALDGNDLAAFGRWLRDEPWLLQPSFVHVQIAVIQRSCWENHRKPFITALLECDPALLRMRPAPPSQALAVALDYGNADIIPLLTRIWPLPDDLPHAAGTGNLAAVARWFDAAGRPALGPLTHHYYPPKANDLGWGPATTQHILDVSLAWAVLNKYFEVAEFLLEHGANINTDWGTHEAASILHEAAIQGNEDAVKFLVAQGADLAMKDYRYQSNAEGWARYGANNPKMADLLAAAAASRRGKES